MGNNPSETLRRTVADLQSRWGDRIIAPASQIEAVPLPTGLAVLDNQIGGGLWPGRLTVIVGQPTSGATTLALKTLASIQRGEASAVYLDFAGQFDPYLAQRLGVGLAALVVVEPVEPQAAFGIIRDVLQDGTPTLIVADAYGAGLNLKSPDVRRLGQALMASRTALLLMAESAPKALGSLTDVRLKCERLAWIRQGRDVIGLSTRVVIDKDRAGGGGRAVQLELLFGEEQS